MIATPVQNAIYVIYARIVMCVIYAIIVQIPPTYILATIVGNVLIVTGVRIVTIVIILFFRNIVRIVNNMKFSIFIENFIYFF